MTNPETDLDLAKRIEEMLMRHFKNGNKFSMEAAIREAEKNNLVEHVEMIEPNPAGNAFFI